MRRAQPWIAPLAVFGLALALRLALIAIHGADPADFQTGDYTLYKIGGEYIQAHGNLDHDSFLHRPPLFAFLIAALHGDDVAVLLANALIGALLAPLTVILARQLRLGPAAALAAGVIVAVDPASIAYAAFLGAEALSNVLLIVMALALLHGAVDARDRIAPAWGAAAGLALALSVLARPAPYLIWTGLAVVLLVMFPRRWRVVLAYVAVSLAGIGGWVIHNGQTYDNYSVSSVGAYSMLYYRAVSVEHWGTGQPVDEVYVELARRVEERLGHDTSAVDELTRHGHYAGPGALTDAMTRVALDVYLDHPLAYVATIPVGLARLFGWTNILPRWTLVVELPWNLALLAGTAAGLWLAYRRRRWLLFWWVGLFGAYFTIGTIISQTSGLDTRMRTMLAPFMAVACAYAWETLRASRARQEESPHDPIAA